LKQKYYLGKAKAVVPMRKNPNFDPTTKRKEMERPFFTLMLLTAFALSSTGAPPITLYKTLKDYQAGKGNAIGEFEGYEWSKEAVLLLTPPVKGKKPVTHDVTAHWGYTIGDQLYRMFEGLPHIIFKQGKAIYYENGLAHMDIAMEKRDGSDLVYGKYCFISKTIDSPIIYVPSKEAKKAFEQDAELQPFLQCIDKLKWSDAKKIRSCMGKLD
jgi:hypothetical protein